eukprot:CAMPEP_0171429972 /NCGR_PEP_ID=MMETSP0881-20121228/6257_1 /TAXON_ID=67004 /ORGANISM="Thalassiosira weissflogii, Strain CCMP1336" /LENGTH=448 /DNA_ID=CAMNT_0011950011 /DNA_START=44 /DNA_END=1387 /DNA_ORIENTATION=-
MARMLLLRPSSLQPIRRPYSANAAASISRVTSFAPSASKPQPPLPPPRQYPWQQQPQLRGTVATLSECHLHSLLPLSSRRRRRHRRRHRDRENSSSAAGRRPTLFQLPDLSHPSDFLRLAQTAISECNFIRCDLASSLSDGASPPPSSSSLRTTIQRAKRTLHSLDQISNVVCTVIDAAELCRSVHASPLWRRGAADAFGMLSDYIGSLNADENLYRSLMRFVFLESDGGPEKDGDVLEGLPPAYRRMAHAMRREFERDGIHLSYDRREEARETNNAIVGLESLFSNNITEKTKYYDVVGKENADEIERIVPPSVLGKLVRHPALHRTAIDPAAPSVTLSTDPLLTNTLLAHVHSPSLRREIYLESHTSLPENLPVLDSLVKLRHVHSADLLGYPSYAHRVLTDRMAGSPENVRGFLNRMEERCRGVYRMEMETVLNAKRYVEGGGFA